MGMKFLLLLLLTACTGRMQTIVIEKVRVERVPGPPCMDPPPPIEAIDWPNPDPVTGELTIDLVTKAEVMQVLQTAQTFNLLQYRKCLKAAEGDPPDEEEDDSSSSSSYPPQMREACRFTTGGYRRCAVSWRQKNHPRAVGMGWWRSW